MARHIKPLEDDVPRLWDLLSDGDENGWNCEPDKALLMHNSFFYSLLAAMRATALMNRETDAAEAKKWKAKRDALLRVTKWISEYHNLIYGNGE